MHSGCTYACAREYILLATKRFCSSDTAGLGYAELEIRRLEALGLSRPLVLTGGWRSQGFRELNDFAPGLTIDTGDPAAMAFGLTAGVIGAALIEVIWWLRGRFFGEPLRLWARVEPEREAA